jgi:hypothetical protein
MVFVLVNEAGTELSRATAQVSCGATQDGLSAALAAGAWFPLQIGNQWIYRVNNRLATSTYIIWTITRTEQIGDRTYFVLSTGPASAPGNEIRLRSDADGRVYRIANLPNSSEEQLWLDPTAAQDPAALLRITKRGFLYSGPLGKFPGAIVYQSYGALTIDTGIFVHGLGLVESSSSMITGSSGGFTEGLQLISARLGRTIRLSTPSAALQLGSESTRLDITNKRATNCAIPCYFTACGLAGADLPDTYKPCFQVRVHVEQATSAHDSGPFIAQIELRDANNSQVYQTTLPLSQFDGLTDFSLFHQVPLYKNPNAPFPPGNYRQYGTLKRNGEDTGSATLPLRID